MSMQLDAIRHILTSTSADDWRQLDPPVYHHQIGITSGRDEWSMEVVEHDYSATYRAEVNLTIAWGFEVDRDLTFPNWRAFPDPQIKRRNLDVFWAGALVDRITLVSVDGGRGQFVMPMMVDGKDTVTEDEVAVGDLVMSFRSRETSRDYVQRAGISIIPGALREG